MDDPTADPAPGGEARPRRRPRTSVRVRTTVGATAVVGLALVVGGVLLVFVLRRDLTSAVDSAAELRAEDVVVALEAGRDPAEVLAGDDEDETLVQVVEDGRVVAASDEASGLPPLAVDETDPQDVTVPDEDDPYRVVAEDADVGERSVVVVVARSAETVSEGVAAVTGTLAVGLPVLLALVAITAWTVTGRALRPVEEIRREVDAIGDRALNRRVPEPGGRDEIARLATTMNAMLARLEAARDRNRRFVSDASHELRSPIATIRHELEVARADPGRIDLDLAYRLLAEDHRMEGLVDDLLLLARSDEGTLRRRSVAVDLDDVVLAEVRRLRANGGVDVDGSAIEAAQVVGDAGALGRAVRNMVDNAVRHAAGRVELGCRADGSRVAVWVDDDGPGIPTEDRTRVFERFTRLDDARTRSTGGYGLGLAIVADVAGAHGGTATVADAPLGGARVVLTLPAPGC